MLAKYRAGVNEIIAITIIEREGNERAGSVKTIGYPLGGFIKSHQIITTGHHMVYDFIEKPRCHFQSGVWCKAFLQSATWADVMEHENRSAATEDATQHLGCPRIIQDIET